ncbi:Mitogen-activated protein kinase kinase kinase NPK1 [Hibiscus syriacus]|uniref:mitogen-activated protein kinase kinase kinase n=1 Tax=Hibiscus syriacus TaxID=106335 RepID=A0A6A2ZHR4_HIBSY|nr:Mitogen-activated protein kinase kinase kinase NPK1 [Hibiscus syriacus]
MQDVVGSVRRSFVFRSSASGEDGCGGLGYFVEKIGASIRRSRIGLFTRPPAPPALPPVKKTDAPSIRWRKGELIGCGAFGRVYMGMNLDSGELLAVKQVSIAANASKEKTQAQIRELEEEVKLLQNLSHTNIVRYLGTAREDDSLNILLEFVPGGSISSLLGKFGSFPESVVRMYTKQLLLGPRKHGDGKLVPFHVPDTSPVRGRHGDGWDTYRGRATVAGSVAGSRRGRHSGTAVEGARGGKEQTFLWITRGVSNLQTDFGASKKVVELATINGAKSMKGTPYWMAPEVILQTGHSLWLQESLHGANNNRRYGLKAVAALFHIGTTKSHPPIPEHLSIEAKDFLLKCLQKEPELRPSASDLLMRPFVTGNYQEHAVRSSIMEPENLEMASGVNLKNSYHIFGKFSEPGVYWREDSCDNSMFRIDDNNDLEFGASVKFCSVLESVNLNKSFNPICEPTEDWPCKLDQTSELSRSGINLSLGETIEAAGTLGLSAKEENGFSFLCGLPAADDDEEVTETKIRAFLDEKAVELKKLQSPLYEEFYNTLNGSVPTSVGTAEGENILSLHSKSRSPKWLPSRRLSEVADAANIVSPKGHKNPLSNTAGVMIGLLKKFSHLFGNRKGSMPSRRQLVLARAFRRDKGGGRKSLTKSSKGSVVRYAFHLIISTSTHPADVVAQTRDAAEDIISKG